jgi:hypothetical protein
MKALTKICNLLMVKSYQPGNSKKNAKISPVANILILFNKMVGIWE